MTDIVPPVSARRQDRPSDMHTATGSPQPVDNSPTPCGRCAGSPTVLSFRSRLRGSLALSPRANGVASHLVALPSVDDLLAAAVGAVPGGASRPGQQTMAEAVAQATREKEHLL